jgi:hypothetical protein
MGEIPAVNVGVGRDRAERGDIALQEPLDGIVMCKC